ncbi:MAG: Na+/H+ antiporter NhaA [Streptosporangiaceae bacterium]
MAALVFGKFLGICLGTWLPLRLNLGDLPGNLVWGQLFGGAAVSGIGFTVSLFITDLAFEDPALQSQAKIGIIAGSLIAAGAGWLVFKMAWDRGSVCAPPVQPGEPAPYAGPLLDPVTADDHVLGSEDAPVTLIEYGDFECPYCGRAENVLAELREVYGDRLRQVFRHFPLRQLHPHAIAAALVAESAADAGRFWEMHDLLFRNQLNLTDADLARYAEELGVSPWADLALHRERLEASLASGLRNGVRGTPSFFVNGVRHEGAHDLRSFRAAIEAELARLDARSV